MKAIDCYQSGMTVYVRFFDGYDYDVKTYYCSQPVAYWMIEGLDEFQVENMLASMDHKSFERNK